MLKIRLMRIGAKKRPFYRVVAVDERAKRNGAYIELLGTYNPLTTPHEINLKKDRIDYWLKQGAVKSDGFLRIIGEAPQRPPRKPKKQKQVVSSKQQGEEKPVDETAQANTLDGGSVSEAKADSSEVSTPETPAESSETVIASETKQSSSDENPDKIATEPTAPRNDEVKEEEKTDERPA